MDAIGRLSLLHIVFLGLMKTQGLKAGPPPGDIIRNGRLVATNEDNRRTIIFREGKASEKRDYSK